jgi:hypothetical protein
LVERGIGSGGGQQAVEMAPGEWLEANVRAGENGRFEGHVFSIPRSQQGRNASGFNILRFNIS